MRTRLLKAWDAVRTSFWFLPALLGTAAAALALATVELDHGEAGRWVAAHDLGYSGGAEGASTLLQTIAASMITIAGVVFSLTLVCLSLASSQFGPRLLRNFMRDRANQVVLGVFVATFLYCVLVLRSVRRADESLFVPHIGVGLALLLAIASLSMLVYYIHHVARIIQADDMVARVGDELVQGICKVYPQRSGAGEPHTSPPLPIAAGRDGAPIIARAEGYLQLVDMDALVSRARDAGVVVRIEQRPGDYVMLGMPLASIVPGARADEALRKALVSCFALGSMRTPVHDLRFPLQQLVEMAVRALSPSTNDPFTALACIDRIAAAMRRLAARGTPSAFQGDGEGSPRVIAPAVAFEEMVALACDPIRHHARGNVAVLLRLLQAIGQIATAAWRPEDFAILQRHADAIARAGGDVVEPDDRAALQRAHLAALAACRIQPVGVGAASRSR